jgi:hypothetical protein
LWSWWTATAWIACRGRYSKSICSSYQGGIKNTVPKFCATRWRLSDIGALEMHEVTLLHTYDF